MNGLKSNLMMIAVGIIVLLALIFAKRELNKALNASPNSKPAPQVIVTPDN